MRRLFLLVPLSIVLLCACHKSNDMVLDKEEMASLLADIHMAEAVVEYNRADFYTDSAKMLLRRSVYDAHGVTPEQVDSSFSYYGYHIEDYMKVYDRVQEILEERQKDLIASAIEKVIAVGDSVDIWPMSRHFEFSRRAPSRILTFSVPVDTNWRDRDVFTLKFHMHPSKEATLARLVVNYADGTSNFALQDGKNNGIGKVSVRIDSARLPIGITGYMLARPKGDETVRIDSISFTRMRANLVQQYIPERFFDYNIKPKPEATDSVAADSVAVPTANHPGGSSVTTTHPAATTPGAHREPGAQAPAAARSAVAPAATAARPSRGASEAQQAVQNRNRLLQHRAAKKK